jgi:hypothetical protein
MNRMALPYNGRPLDRDKVRVTSRCDENWLITDDERKGKTLNRSLGFICIATLELDPAEPARGPKTSSKTPRRTATAPVEAASTLTLSLTSGCRNIQKR